MIKVLVACEHSGVIRDAFRRRGIAAWSNDLGHIEPEGEFPEFHLKGDCLMWMSVEPWTLLIAHPPCTFVCSSGLHWNKRRPERAAQTEEAVAFAKMLIDNPLIPHVAVENPIGCLSTRIRKPDQVVQPYQYGHDASKATCLWLKGLPLLVPDPELYVPGRQVGVSKTGKPLYRWANQTDSGQNNLGPSDDRWKERSKTYEGIGEAVAKQWGDYLEQLYGAQSAGGFV